MEGERGGRERRREGDRGGGVEKEGTLLTY